MESLEQQQSDCEENPGNTTFGQAIHDVATRSLGNDDEIGNSSNLLDTNYTVHRNVVPHHIERTSSQIQSPYEQIQSSGNDLISTVECNNDGDDVNTASLHQSMELEERSSVSPNDLDVERTTSIEGLVDWWTDKQGFVDLFVKHGLEYTAMDDISVLFGAPCR